MVTLDNTFKCTLDGELLSFREPDLWQRARLMTAILTTQITPIFSFFVYISKQPKGDGRDSFSRVILEEIAFFMHKIDILGMHRLQFFAADLFGFTQLFDLGTR